MNSSYWISDPRSITVKPEDLTVWKSTITGLTYGSREHMLDEEAKHKMRHGRTQEDELMDSLSAEQIRALDTKVRKASEQKAQDKEEFTNAVLFSKLHPEYKVCPQNAARMVHYFSSQGITHVNLEMMESGFEALKADGLLVLDENVLRQQEVDEIEQRAEKIRQQRAAVPAEADLYESPLENRPRFGWFR
jgi:hypothetical protein